MPNLAAAAEALRGIAAAASPSGRSDAQYAKIRSVFLADLSDAAKHFMSGANQRVTVNLAKRLVTEAYHAAAQAAAGGPVEGEDLALVNAEVSAEFDFIEQLFGDLKMRRAAGETSLPTVRLDLYANSLDALYSAIKARSAMKTMLTFDGPDGKESCPDCQRMKGQRHSAKWWVSNNKIPAVPGTTAYECGGWLCEHYLRDDKGNRFTI